MRDEAPNTVVYLVTIAISFGFLGWFAFYDDPDGVTPLLSVFGGVMAIVIPIWKFATRDNGAPVLLRTVENVFTLIGGVVILVLGLTQAPRVWGGAPGMVGAVALGCVISAWVMMSSRNRQRS